MAPRFAGGETSLPLIANCILISRMAIGAGPVGGCTASARPGLYFGIIQILMMHVTILQSGTWKS